MSGPGPLVYDMDLQALKGLMASWGEPRYRAGQIFHALYVEMHAAAEGMTTLPASLRERLAGQFSFESLSPRVSAESQDGQTTKTLFGLRDGNAVETVLMRYRKRRTLCISTQSGCAMGCVFCATGQMGFRGNLSRGQIAEQVLFFARQLKQAGERVTNIVFMGMGEPFHNYDETMAAIDLLNHPGGMGLGARRFTVSTVGLVPAIRRFTAEKRQVNLAISLHSVDDELRSSMLPVNRRYPLAELIAACREYVQRTSRRITFEWALIHDVNDSPKQARRLGALVGDLNCHVNVIPLNPTGGYSGVATTRARARAFQAELESSGVPCTIRVRRGIDIRAGCGQLAQREQP